ncbi:hypothetical protein CsSME_00010108 [Camellia sinensis var. sinensis]
MAWCVQMRGPLFVSVFSPLMLVLVAIAGSLLLDEKLHLGSVIGAGVIVCGLYMVLWGKGKELKRITQLMPSKSARESECIDIIVTSLTENNNGSSNDIVAVIPSSPSILYNDALDVDILEINKKEEQQDKSSEVNVNV